MLYETRPSSRQSIQSYCPLKTIAGDNYFNFLNINKFETAVRTYSLLFKRHNYLISINKCQFYFLNGCACI